MSGQRAVGLGLWVGAAASRADHCDLKRLTGDTGKMVGMVAQLARHFATDNAKTGDADTKWGG